MMLWPFTLWTNEDSSSRVSDNSAAKLDGYTSILEDPGLIKYYETQTPSIRLKIRKDVMVSLGVPEDIIESYVSHRNFGIKPITIAVRHAAIQRAARHNCLDIKELITKCKSSKTIQEENLENVCSTAKERYDMCLAMQVKLLYGLGYMSEQANHELEQDTRRRADIMFMSNFGTATEPQEPSPKFLKALEAVTDATYDNVPALWT
ncbi:hypothetical protein V1511DRAFT_495343 [Dipodascopsis uninucleata]